MSSQVTKPEATVPAIPRSVYPQACRLRLGLAVTDDLIRASVELLEAGFQHPKIFDIALERIGVRPDRSIHPVFEEVMIDLGLWPSHREATEYSIAARWNDLLEQHSPLEDFAPAAYHNFSVDIWESEVAALVADLDDGLPWMTPAQREECHTEIRSFCQRKLKRFDAAPNWDF